MSFKSSIRLKTAIHHLMLSFDTVFMCKIGVNYISRAMNMFFRKRLGCAVIGACAIIRMNIVVNIFNRASGFQQSYNVSNQIVNLLTSEHQRP